jgi:hypothetical protein
MKRIFISCFFTLFFAFGQTFSQEEGEQIVLKSSDVKTFINAFPQIKTDLERLDIKYDNDNYDFTIPEAAEILNKVNNIVTKHGYTDYTDFLVKTAAIAITYSSIRINRESANAQPEFEEAIKDIESNPNYTAEQKEQMVAMLKQSSQTLSTMSKDMADPRNVAVVTPFVNELETVFDED